jgi:hypothetical protein
VTARDVSGSDMPRLPWSARRDGSAIQDTALAALLEGGELPAGAAAELRPVADMLAALRAGAASDELTGLAAAQAEFRHAGPARPHRSRRQRPARLRGKAAAAAVIAAIGLAGAGAAAYAGALPASWQQFAHRTIGAPAPRQDDGDARSGPHGTGRAAEGLCTAYQRARVHGTADQQAAALRKLVRAAGGAGNVTAFCAAVPRAHSSAGRAHPHHATRPVTHPAKRPNRRPPGRRSKPPPGPPSVHVPGAPAAHPSAHPSAHP